MPDHDVIFAGGGLAGTLAAYRLKARRPELRILVVEQGASLGGNHTWSFHETDLTGRQHAWIAPFVVHRWPAQTVRFPKFSRSMPAPYCSVTSEQLDAVARRRLGASSLRTGSAIKSLDEGSVTLDGGETLTAACVIDARGASPSAALRLGFQKFLGLEVRLAQPHGETAPMIMDASVTQDDGYRFVYTLPFTADTMLIEDTYYADGPDVAPDNLRRKILAYAASRGWHVKDIIREETGTLPIVLSGDIDAFWREASAAGGAATIGLRACLFHPTTGYSLPDAVAMADALTAPPELTTAGARALVEAHSKRLWRERGFYRMLNRFLFLAARPEKRFQIMQRFYSLGQPLIERFYRAASTPADKARIMIGRPPVSIFRVLAHIRENGGTPPGGSR